MILVGKNKAGNYITKILNKSEEELIDILLETNFQDELYYIENPKMINIWDSLNQEFIEFNGIFANEKLFNVCKKYLSINLYAKYIYHHTTLDNLSNIQENGIIPQVGDIYESYIESYWDEIEEIADKFNFADNTLFVDGIFLCTETNYSFDYEDEIILCIDTSKLDKNYLYRDFNETDDNCYFYTKVIPPEAIISIGKYDENGDILDF